MHDIAIIRKIKRDAKRGIPVSEMARKMGISVHTVRYHANKKYRHRLNKLHMQKYYAARKLLAKSSSSRV